MITVQPTSILANFCKDNGIRIEEQISETIRMLGELGVHVEQNIINAELGHPGNSRAHPINSDTFGIIIDPLAIVGASENEDRIAVLRYEISHEICHAVVSRRLRILENATLEVTSIL